MPKSKQHASRDLISNIRREMDSLGAVDVAADMLWGAQTQRSLEHFSIGKDLIPREMITAYATLTNAAASTNRAHKLLTSQLYPLIAHVSSVIPAGPHHDP